MLRVSKTFHLLLFRTFVWVSADRNIFINRFLTTHFPSPIWAKAVFISWKNLHCCMAHSNVVFSWAAENDFQASLAASSFLSADSARSSNPFLCSVHIASP